jgi:cytolysin (calcineurin-like family phosphatase)
MKHIEVDCYEVYEGYDRNFHLVGRFTNYADALRLKQTSNYYSLDSKPKKISISVYESYEEYEEAKSVSVQRKKALEKLTYEEKKLLGLV